MLPSPCLVPPPHAPSRRSCHAVIFHVIERPAELVRRTEAEAAVALYTAAAAKMQGLSPEELSLIAQYAPSVGPEDYQNWTFSGSFFFSSTIVTTIGYGSFTCQTNQGKIFLIFYALLGIGAAAPVFGFVGEYVIKTARKCMGVRDAPTAFPSVGDVKQGFSKYDTDHSGGLDQQEICAAIEDMGLDITAEELHDLIASHWSDTRSDHLHDKDLDSHEFAEMVNAFTMMKSADEGERAANRDLLCVLLLAIVIVFGGAAIYCGIHPTWTYLDSIYFCIVTLTTVRVLLSRTWPGVQSKTAAFSPLVVTSCISLISFFSLFLLHVTDWARRHHT